MKTPAKKILIAGCGDIGTRLGLQLAAQGWKVYALRRNTSALPPPLIAIRADLGDPASLRALPGDVDFVLYTATAARFDEAHYRAVYVDGVRNVLAASPSPNFFFVSSSAVYGQDDGAWVNEESATAPRHFNGRVMLEGEHVARAAGGVCVRFSGIYGPRRTRLVDAVRRGQLAPASPVVFSNRIHVEDCAGVLAHLFARRAAGDEVRGVYLASDDAPAPLAEVQRWLAGRLRVPAGQGTGAAPVRRAGSKRCDNALIKKHGYRFLFPDYKAGYRAMLGAD
ncbi:MAG: sugar nucleotide-binding protein [Gammaproteobacteria bacterium]|nr:sugar nucleotide-binding protein [Gammaproteobacteria bacterium]